ncbi:MAG: metal-dependent hydrolase, partial [Actinomycetes bacterium]
REWLVLIPVSAYAMVGMCVAAWSIGHSHWGRAAEAALAWARLWL